MTAKTGWTALRVLIVDRDSDGPNDLRSALQSAGHRVVGWSNRQSHAYELACLLRPDAILLDVELEEGDGIDLAAQLSQCNIGPVVVLTKHVRIDLARRAAAAGVFAYLTRPVEASKLHASIDIARGLWLQTRQQARRLEDIRKRLLSRELIDRAKEALIASCGYTEPQAYRHLQELSMNTRKPMRDVAERLLSMQEEVDGIEPEPVDPREISGAA
jgi:response regulator NasT